MIDRLPNGTPGMLISGHILEGVCKKMIEIILHCLPQATRGTIYTVGPIPELRVVRMASGQRHEETGEIQWDGTTQSDYNFPGKVWEDYQDRPGGILEAMAWCVETQKSWTADAPEHNCRSVRKQLQGKAGEDYHHMEPVLVKKTELWDQEPPLSAYPKDYQEKLIWQESQYATVAVFKIHFLPGRIKQGDSATQIIKKLSHSLGTQMLSLHAKEVAIEKVRKLAEERKETCKTFAHEFRNISARLGFAYRAVNNEIAYLRESWENLVHQHLPEQASKRANLQQLDKILKSVAEKHNSPDVSNEITRLALYQEQLMESCLLPQRNEIWLRHKIRPLWLSVLKKTSLNSTIKKQIEDLLQSLSESFYVGQDTRVIDKINDIPQELKSKWVDLVYREITGKTNGMITQYIELLDNISVVIPRKKYSLRNFIYLRSLIKLIPEIEEKLNRRLASLKDSDVSIHMK